MTGEMPEDDEYVNSEVNAFSEQQMHTEIVNHYTTSLHHHLPRLTGPSGSHDPTLCATESNSEVLGNSPNFWSTSNLVAGIAREENEARAMEIEGELNCHILGS